MKRTILTATAFIVCGLFSIAYSFSEGTISTFASGFSSSGTLGNVASIVSVACAISVPEQPSGNGKKFVIFYSYPRISFRMAAAADGRIVWSKTIEGSQLKGEGKDPDQSRERSAAKGRAALVSRLEIDREEIEAAIGKVMR